MAYTDFTNVDAPIYWDQAQSGVIIGSGSPNPSNLAAALSYVTNPLADFWDGTKYDFTYEDPENPGEFLTYVARILMVAEELFDTTEIYIDQESASTDGPAVTLFGTDGEKLPGADLANDASAERIVISGNRIVYRLTKGQFGGTESMAYSGVKAIMMTGFLDFPQGRPKFHYGLYGPTISVETQFWTGFQGRQNLWPFKQRLTELF